MRFRSLRRRIRWAIFLAFANVAVGGIGWAQTAVPTAQTKPTAQVKPAPQKPVPVRVVVRDQSGVPLADARVTVAEANQSVLTDATGVAAVAPLRVGVYRFRFDREGFIPLERDVAIRPGRAVDVEVALSLAPAPPPPPPPPPPVEPPPPEPPPPPPPPPPPLPSGPPTFVDIPGFLDKNFVGRDPLKESVFGCTAGGTTRLLQLRENLADHEHADLDEVIYVVAGNGAVRLKDQTTVVAPGGLVVIPRGVTHAIERRGRNPLIVVSVLSGAPCRTAGTSR
jgi:hypothetical protein